MVDRISALHGHYHQGKFGLLNETGAAGVSLEDVTGLVLHQVAAWPESVGAIGDLIVKATACQQAPGPCQVEVNNAVAVLRIEPLKWWIHGVSAPDIEAEQGATLDLSHSRTQIRVTGDRAANFLNRHLPLDLREESFTVGSVASTAVHHVGVTLWRSDQGYELFIPRGFALSLWEGMLESAMQFGLEVV